MTKLQINYDDGTSVMLVSKQSIPPNNNIPSPVIPPDCWEVLEGDGQKPAMHLMDYDAAVRSGTSLGETGMWYVVSWIDVSDGRVKNPKHIVNLQGTSWLDWTYDILGEFNFAQKARHQDGTEDLNDDSIPVYLSDGSINPNKPRKQMCTVTGGAILNVVDYIRQGGVLYYIIETMDFYKQPVKINDVWHYDGKALTWENAPHLFTSRINRKVVKPENQTWISKRGVHGVSDGGVDEDGNLYGAKLKEWWPNPSKAPVCLPVYDTSYGENIKFFPELPAQIHLYKNSVIVDGELTPQTGGIIITADGWRFGGSKIWIRDKATKKWYLASEMLIRANVLTGYYARATDYRCYWTLLGSTLPPMGDRGYGIPDPGLWRKDMGVLFYTYELIGKTIHTIRKVF